METAPIVGEPLGDAAPVRVEQWSTLDRVLPPSSDAPRWEAVLAEGNRVAAERSRASLRQTWPAMTSLLDVDALGRPFPTDDPGPVPGLVDGLIDELVTDHALPPQRVWLHDEHEAAHGAVASVDHGYGIVRPDLIGLAERVRSGASVAFLRVDEHRADLGRWMEDLDRSAGSRCRVDLVVAGWEHPALLPAGPACALVALGGTARVDTAAPTGRGGAGPLPTSTAIEEGGALLVPPGWEIRLTGTRDVALVARVVVPTVTVDTLVAAVASEAVLWPTLRGYVPNHPDERVLSYAGSVFDDPTGIATALAAIADEGSIGRAIARHRASTPARWTGDLRPALGVMTSAGRPAGASFVRSPLPGGIQVGPPQDDGSVVWFAAGRKLRLSQEAADALAPLASARSVAVDDEAGVDPRLLRAAVAVGLAQVEEGTP